MALEGEEQIVLQEGDFALIPAAFGVVMSSFEAPATGINSVPVALGQGMFRIGAQEGPTNLRILAGHCTFRSPDAALLISLLPQRIHVRDEPRFALLVRLLDDESRGARPAREVILAHLLEVLLIEALRSTAGTSAAPGLVPGLADVRLSIALRAIHREPARAWTVAELAKEAALSRSTFFTRFKSTVGVSPMEYLVAWRMALAKDLLGRSDVSVGATAERVGYSSTSSFSIAFSRRVGRTPTQFANAHRGRDRRS